MNKKSDKNFMLRTAQPLVVETRRCSAAGVDSAWTILWGVVVEQIQLNHGAAYNTATLLFANTRWDQPLAVGFGWQIRIRTAASPFRVVFMGFAAGYKPSFVGGSQEPREEVAVECFDFRWFLAKTSPVFGQCARGVDDYESNGTPKLQARYFTGRPLIFNADGKPNRDPISYTISGSQAAYKTFTMRLFADKNNADFWSARQMLEYLLTNFNNKYFAIFPLILNDCPGISHADFDRQIHSVNCEGLPLTDAVEKICKNIGWTFREQYTADGAVWVFYKPGSAAGKTRSTNDYTILHTLHAPAVNEAIDVAIAAGSKMLYAANFAQSIDSVVNNPWGLGDVHTFEITAELVPAWLDSDLTLDSASSYANLFKTDADLAAETNPNQYSFFSRYHARGSSFQRDIGRKWVLNELGNYTGGSYDRGDVFDFAAVIPAQYITDPANSERLYGPFSRTLKPCLTFDKDSLSSVGIRVEFSFDSGASWQLLPATIENLTAECGIRITTQNLAELVDLNKGTLTGTLAGKEINYFTSLADDMVNSRVFKTGGWKTRCRITATIEMDNRLVQSTRPQGQSGSPFLQAAVYNFKDKYTFSKRTPSSAFIGTNLPAWETDESDKLYQHIDGIRQANEDLSINGSFTLERLWLGDGNAAQPDFMLGDCIEGLTGRTKSFAQSVAGRTVYPEVIQITYNPVQQKQLLITRDLRLAETA
jgi:hypothetical protein